MRTWRVFSLRSLREKITDNDFAAQNELEDFNRKVARTQGVLASFALRENFTAEEQRQGDTLMILLSKMFGRSLTAKTQGREEGHRREAEIAAFSQRFFAPLPGNNSFYFERSEKSCISLS